MLHKEQVVDVICELMAFRCFFGSNDQRVETGQGTGEFQERMLQCQ